MLFSIAKTPERLRQILYYVTGNKAFHTKILSGKVAGKAVQVHAKHTSVGLFVATRQQTGYYTGKHIATAGGSHARIARGVEHNFAVRHTQSGIMSFQYYIGLQAFGHVARTA